MPTHHTVLLLIALLLVVGCPEYLDSMGDDDTWEGGTPDDDTGDDGDDDTGDDGDDDTGDDGDDDTGDDGDDDTAACVDGSTTSGPDGTTWVTICGGTYPMGSNVGLENELPVHPVSVPTFEMLETEVTATQYEQCVEAGGCSVPNTGDRCTWNEPGYGDHPVNCVEWQQAVNFCAWVGSRLPNESEWEYAARSGGQDITYPWGDEEATCDHAVMEDTTHIDGCDTVRTWPVCSKTDGNTDQGLCDMSGNVWEWVQDWSHIDYQTPCCAPEDGSAWEEDPYTIYRVIRGGGFGDDAVNLRAAGRIGIPPFFDMHVLGFRCAR